MTLNQQGKWCAEKLGFAAALCSDRDGTSRVGAGCTVVHLKERGGERM